ncbi:Polysaccharide biosynthesis protein [Turicibacter sanguinis]|nr:Polysaccharide biosynthesis protein [Turicibacter sanguinis]
MNKRIIINLITSLTSFTVSTGINFLLTPYITDSVGGTAAYGFVGLANNMIGYISIITLALTSMSGRYITISIYEKNNEKSNTYFNSVLYASIVLGVLVLIISGGLIINLDQILSIPDEIYSDVQWLFIVLILNFIVSLCCTAFSVTTFSMNRLDLSALRTMESNILRAAILIVLFLFLSPSIIYLGIATLVAGIYINIFNIYYTKKLLPQIKFKRQYFSLQATIEIIKSGLWNVFNRLSSIFSTGLDLLITNLFVGSNQMGILSISKSLPTMILSLFAMIANVFAPQITANYATGNNNKLKSTILTAMKLLGMISCIPMTVLIVYGKEFYHLWLPNENATLLHILSLLACIEYIFVLPLEPLWNLFTAAGKIKVPAIYMFINSILSISTVFLLLTIVEDTFLKLLIIAGISMVFSIIRALIFLPLYGAYCMNVKWYTFYNQILKNTISVVLMVTISLVGKIFIDVNSWVVLILVTTIITIISLVINYYFILEKKDREVIIQVLYTRVGKLNFIG